MFGHMLQCWRQRRPTCSATFAKDETKFPLLRMVGPKKNVQSNTLTVRDYHGQLNSQYRNKKGNIGILGMCSRRPVAENMSRRLILHNHILIRRSLFNFNVSKRVSKLLQWIKDFWLRIKWILIRSKRPFNWEDIAAFISWLLTGNIMLLLIGTTTFVSLVLVTMRIFTDRDVVAEWLSKLVTKNTNLTATFESVVVPDWKYGTIQLKNCKISRRPKVVKIIEKVEKSIDGKVINKTFEEEYDDGNYTQFDITIDEINVSLSFWRWISGKGIVDTSLMKCIRGVIDRTHVVWKKGDDPRNYKNVYKPGDWEIENFVVEDVLLTMYNPNGFRPTQLSIYNADLKIFRKNWLMIDVLTCNHLSGCYDGSLFTINKISSFDTFKDESRFDLLVNRKLGREQFSRIPFQSDNFQKIVRFRMDNLKIEHLNRGMEGPFGWITNGTVDILADFIMLEENISLNALLGEGFNNFSNQFLFNKKKLEKHNDDLTLNGTNTHAQTVDVKEEVKDDENLFICDFFLTLKNPKAQVPLFTNDLSYINNAAIRPIVGYINNNKTFIPIRGRIYKDLSDFDGSWTFYDSLLMDDLSEAVYQSFFDYVADEKMRNERLRKVGFWSIQFVLQFILWSFTTLGG